MGKKPFKRIFTGMVVVLFLVMDTLVMLSLAKATKNFEPIEKREYKNTWYISTMSRVKKKSGSGIHSYKLETKMLVKK